jgi:hypothetical protein
MNVAEIEKVDSSSNKVSFGDLVKLFQTHTFTENSDIVAFLDKLRQGLHDEKEAHLVVYTEQKQLCREDLEFRNNEIAAATESEKTASAHKSLCSSERDEAVSLKELAAAAKVVYEAALETRRKLRAEEHALYVTRSRKLKDAHDAIVKTLEMLDIFEIEAENSGFGRVAELIQKTNSLLAISASIGSTAKVLPIYSKLIQSHSNQRFDINDIDEVRDRITDLLQNVDEAASDLDAKEAINKANFEKDEADLIDLIARLQAQIEASDAYILKMDSCIESEGVIVSMATGKIQRNTELLVQATKICEDNETEWTEAERARKNQHELLNQLQFAIEALEHEYGESLLPDIKTIIKVE